MDKRDFRDELAHGKEQAPWEGDAQGGVPSVALPSSVTQAKSVLSSDHL